MGAVPNKKVTRARAGRKFMRYRLSPLHPSVCPRCRSPRLPHTACPRCGTYKGRQVLGVSN
ncbi:MAG: 50S ribosomal protein L32 [SAR202 cluster bacterium]|nr:50S ribosomal protein L32 [SAR202 cluster bacterium]